MKDQIWNIIAAHIHGEENTPGEERQLKEWLEQCLENQQEYRIIERFYKENAGLKTGAFPETGKAWGENRTRLMYRKALARRRLYRLTTYAALIILIISSSLFWYFIRERAVRTPTVAEIQPVIQPGSPKATLTLASGETLDLHRQNRKMIREQTGMIRNENNTLEYTSHSKAVTLEYNTLDIPRGGEYQLILEDGTKVWLNSDTRLRYPVAFGKTERRIYLEGEAYFQVQKDPARPFIVRTGGVDVTALGTEFNITRRNTIQEVYTTLVKGSVRVTLEKGKSCILKPSEQAVCRPDSQTPEIRQVNTALYTSWKDGYYMFERQTLREIMNTLARWYDIKVFFSNQEVSMLRFSGRLKRYEDITNLLNMIRLTNDVNFEINGKTIIVRNKINRK